MDHNGVPFWQGIVATSVLVAAGGWALTLYVNQWPDAPTRYPAGVVLVDVATTASSVKVQVRGDYSAALNDEDGQPGAFVLTVATTDLTAGVSSVRLLFCGAMAEAKVRDFDGRPLATSDVTGSVDRNAIFDGIPLRTCRELRSPAGPVQAFVIQGQIEGGWGSQAGDQVLYAFPGLMAVPGFGGIGGSSGVVSLDQLPSDLRDVVTSPSTDDPGLLAWRWSDGERPPSEYRLSASLRNVTQTQQRSVMLLGLALGLATSAAVWLLEILVGAGVARRRRTDRPTADGPVPSSPSA